MFNLPILFHTVTVQMGLCRVNIVHTPNKRRAAACFHGFDLAQTKADLRDAGGEFTLGNVFGMIDLGHIQYARVPLN